jgi:hypothetical protein
VLTPSLKVRAGVSAANTYAIKMGLVGRIAGNFKVLDKGKDEERGTKNK